MCIFEKKLLENIMLKEKMIKNEYYNQLTQNYIQEQIFIAIVNGI